MRATMLFVLLPVFWMCHGVRAQEAGSDLPNPQLTPGDSVNVSAADICKPNYKNRRSKVSAALKSQVFARYRLNGYDLGYNVELLIPASLGGSNSITNLWPQRLSAEWSWQRKNRLEHRLRKLVCNGELDLKQAQREISTNWIDAYKKYIGGLPQK